uniref:Uncharacterized protein n=1 Tax=viral metagenome TaxID=1070528 RepID=A0A6C0ACK7_9ZZZZ
MKCSVFGCRFRENHDTINHTCGTCKSYPMVLESVQTIILELNI